MSQLTTTQAMPFQPPATRQELDDLLVSSLNSKSILGAVLADTLNELGGMDFFHEWAEDNPSDFVAICFEYLDPSVKKNAVPGTTQAGGIHLHVHPALAPTELDRGGNVIEHDPT